MFIDTSTSMSPYSGIKKNYIRNFIQIYLRVKEMIKLVLRSNTPINETVIHKIKYSKKPEIIMIIDVF